MSFLTIAEPFARLGIRVFPVEYKGKEPREGLHFLSEATTNVEILNEWNLTYRASNVGLLADAQFCFLEFDVLDGLEQAAEEMGESIPETRYQRSGKGFRHCIFRHTDRSRKIGNRSVNLPEGGEWFSFRANNKYLVGAGSVHPNGNRYETLTDVEPIPTPDWILDWIEKHSLPATAKSNPKGCAQVSDDFDIDEFFDHYGISIDGVKDDVWHIVSKCPGVGYRHEQSILTGFYYDGETFGWNCFAQGCPLNGKSVGEVIKFLNDSHDPYKGVIWEQDNSYLNDPAFGLGGIEELEIEPETDKDEPPQTLAVEAPKVTPTPPSRNTLDETEFLMKLPGEDWRVSPTEEEDLPFESQEITIVDPVEREGLEFPGGCAMYGVLGDIARTSPYPDGWVYPALLTVAAALGVKDSDGNIRSNLYTTLLGEVGAGKSVAMQYSLDAISISISKPGADDYATAMLCNPASDRGLIKVVGTHDLPRLIVSDEFRTVMLKCGIQGSSLAPLLCELWSKDIAGVSDKKGTDECVGQLSILGNVAISDPMDFAKVFGSATTAGLSDRQVYGYSEGAIVYRPTKPTKRFIKVKPVRVPTWVWEAKDRWQASEPKSRRRLAEIVLRVALIQSAANSDPAITKESLQAAFRFGEWQEHIRNVYKAGLAENPTAICEEAIFGALQAQADKQAAAGKPHKGAPGYKDNLRYVHFSQCMNNKSYYRKFGSTLINRCREAMVKEGILAVVMRVEKDEDDNDKKATPTPFVYLRGKVR